MARSDDKKLVDRLRKGDSSAYAELLAEYGDRLYATAKRMCRSESDAADAMQDAMITCMRAISGFKGESSLYTWLHRVTVTSCLMKLRKQKRRKEASIEPLLPAYYDEGHRVSGPEPAWECSAEDVLARKESCQMVRECIEKLPEDYRNVLQLRDIEGLDTAETAKLLETNEGVVKTRLHRARQALRSLLEPYMKGKP